MQNKIYLRDFQTDDAMALYSIYTDENLRKSGLTYYRRVEDALAAINTWRHITDNSLFNKAIIEKMTENMIGLISLGDMNRYRGYYEIEYAISSEHRNRGYATQALQEMLLFAFEECKAEVVAAWVRSHNEPSVRVLEKCGFVFEGKLRKHARDKSDTLCYSITSDDWSSLENIHINKF